ncbi:hypothetical protein [Streptomyces sp. SudanB52_2052]|uniref:hypothetical protein n=1 Tax=Streptomyces sp. SudanB52_2052 TaxID=3035276 RepID=UPI003F550D4E
MREGNKAGAFGSRWNAAVAFFEELECLGSAGIDALVHGLGDADALVVVPDLGLVVPQHGQTAVAADAVQAQSDNLAATAPGGDDGLPDVPQAPVVEVEFLQAAQVGLVGQRAGDVVAEGVAGTLLEAGAAEGDGGQEAGVDAEAFGVAGGNGAVEQLACLVEDELAAQIGDGGGSSVDQDHAQGRQAVAGAVALVGDEPLGVFTAQHGGVVACLGCVGLEEDAQFDGGAAHLVEGASGTGTLRGTEPLGEVVPEQVAQPPLRYGGDVEVALGVLEASPEVIGLQETGVLGVRGAVVDTAQTVDDLPDDFADLGVHLLACQAGVAAGVQVHQGRDAASLAMSDEIPDAVGGPLGVLCGLGMGVQAPLDLGPQQRGQRVEVDQSWL